MCARVYCVFARKSLQTDTSAWEHWPRRSLCVVSASRESSQWSETVSGFCFVLSATGMHFSYDLVPRGSCSQGHKAVPGDVPAALDGEGAEARDAALTLRRPGRPRRESGPSRRRGRGREPPSSQDSQDTPPRRLLLSPRSCSSRVDPTSSCHPCDIFMS